METDAIGSSRCVMKMGSLPVWESYLKYEATMFESLPHTVVYIEAGYSDGNAPGYTARVLNASGVSRVRGFFTNDTHGQWTIKEVRWGQRVSRLTHGAHFIVNTATNGRGPLLNRHPTHQGVEALCNPPGRGSAAPHHQHHVRAGRRVPVDGHAGRQQRPVQGRDGVRHLVVQEGTRARGQGSGETRARLPETPVLTVATRTTSLPRGGSE